MNKLTENGCLPIFEFKFKFLENSRKPLTLKSTRWLSDEKPKWQRRESQTTGLAEKNQTSVAKEIQTGIIAEKGQTSILENQTNVACTDDELTRDDIVSKTSKKVQVHPCAVCSPCSGKITRQTLDVIVSSM